MSYTSPNIVPSGTPFTQFKGGGATGLLERLITANFLGTSAPGNPIVVSSSSGRPSSSLAAGRYYVCVTETNGMGETTPSEPEAVEIEAGESIEVRPRSLQPGNAAWNLYVGTTPANVTLQQSGIPGTERDAEPCFFGGPLRYDTSAVPPPRANSTGLTTVHPSSGVIDNQKLSGLRACECGDLQHVWDGFERITDAFNRGEPIAFSSITGKIRDAHTVFAMLAQVCREAGELVDANPGHFTNVPTGIGARKTVRQWGCRDA